MCMENNGLFIIMMRSACALGTVTPWNVYIDVAGA